MQSIHGSAVTLASMSVNANEMEQSTGSSLEISALSRLEPKPGWPKRVCVILDFSPAVQQWQIDQKIPTG